MELNRRLPATIATPVRGEEPTTTYRKPEANIAFIFFHACRLFWFLGEKKGKVLLVKNGDRRLNENVKTLYRRKEMVKR